MSKKVLVIFVLALAVPVGGAVIYFGGGVAQLSHMESSKVESRQVVPGEAGISATAGAKTPASSRPTPNTSERRPAYASRDGTGRTLADLEGESGGRWIVRKRSDGTVAKLTEGRLRLDSRNPAEAADSFLSLYSAGVLGVPFSAIGERELVQEAEGAQVIAPQILNGLPVDGSRINMIFDGEGNLVYVVSDVYSGAPLSPTPAVSSGDAAIAARSGLLQYIGESSPDSAAAYPLGLFEQSGRLVYRLASGNLSLVYKYEFPLKAPRIGDMVVLIDANLGTAVLVQSLSRK